MTNAVDINSVSKKFNLSHQPQRTPVGFWRKLLGRRSGWNESFWALRDVSFTVARGETVGLIGSNGSGKSTILKLIAKIIQPTNGQIKADGRIAAILELGAGFHHELSGRDNIFLNASILGLRHKEIGDVYDEVVSFSELERFIDTPVKFYSSGMYARLAFAVAMHVKPNILLIDEALSVGDQAFQAKCIARVIDMKRNGATILVVSHDLETIQSLCDRVIWLDAGHVQDTGKAPDVVTAYLDHVARKSEQAHATYDDDGAHGPDRRGNGKVKITQVELCDGRGFQRDVFVTGGPMTLRLHYRAQVPVPDPVFGISVYHQSGVLVCGPTTGASSLHIPLVEGEGIVAYDIPSLPLIEGTYAISVSVNDRQGLEVYDHQDHGGAFRVFAGKSRERYGLASLQGEWRILERRDMPPAYSAIFPPP